MLHSRHNLRIGRETDLRIESDNLVSVVLGFGLETTETCDQHGTWGRT